MNRKITFPELTSLLAARTGESKRVCELFLKNFFASISTALANGESVKVKGLGTFRLNEIESRKSVNVNTGLEFEIPGHRRVTFVAAPSLAERVNEPFQAFESVEIADEVTDEMLEAIEIPDEALPKAEAAAREVPETPEAEGPIGEEPSDEPAPELPTDEPAAEESERHSFIRGGFSFVGDEPEETDEKAVVEEPKEAVIANQSTTDESADEEPDAYSYNLEENEDEIIPVPEENDTESVTEDLKQAEQPAVVEPPVIPQPATLAKPVVNQPVEPEPIKFEGEPDKPVKKPESPELPERKKSRNFGWGFVAGLLTCIIVGAVAFALYYNYSQQEQMAQVVAPKDTVKTVSQPAPVDTVAPVADTAAVEKENPIEPVKEEVSADKEKEKVADTKPSDAPVYDTITKTRYLTTMAKEHYGNYHLWPYIYEANKSLGHPDRIRPGTKVIVPSLAKLGVNPDNPNDIAAAKRKGVKIYSRYKK